jgi:hypothetical protein
MCQLWQANDKWESESDRPSLGTKHSPPLTPVITTPQVPKPTSDRHMPLKTPPRIAVSNDVRSPKF